MTTLNSFLRFRGECDLLFREVDSNLMVEYETFLKGINVCPNISSFNMRNLRAIYNRAVEKELTVLFYIKKFADLGCDVKLSTNDGSQGVKGFVSDVMVQEGLTNLPYFACGPMPMLKAVWRTSNAPGQLSFEERMGCGFGACMGCSCETISGPKRICKEGPVLSSQEVLWTKD